MSKSYMTKGMLSGHCMGLLYCLLLLFPSSILTANTADNDYYVMCEPPFALNATTISDTAVSLSWTSANIPQETEWQLEVIGLNQSFTGNPTHFAIQSNPYQLNGLQSGTYYSYKVRAVCGGVPGNWSVENFTFYTAIDNGDGCNLTLPIPDAFCQSPTAFPILIQNTPGDTLGANVILDEVLIIVEHEWLIDLEAFLKSPSGKLVQLFDETGGTNDHFGDPSDTTCQTYMTLLNAIACNETPIQEAGPPFTGRYLPMGNFNSFNDGTNPNGLWELLICDDAADNLGQVKYIELLFKPVNCTAPTAITLVSIDSTAVTLDWTQGSDCNQTIIEYGPPGFSPGSGTQVVAGCPPFEVTGLSGGSLYEFYALESCGPNSFSNYTCNSVIAETECSPPPASLYDNFDDLDRCIVALCNQSCEVETDRWFNAQDDEMDWIVNQGNTFTSFTGPSDDITGGGKYLFAEASSPAFFGCSAGSEAILQSACFDVQANMTDSCHLGFFYHMYGRDAGSLRLEATTDGVAWDTIWMVSGDQGNAWQMVRLPLDSFANQTAQFRFVSVKGNGNFGDIAIDEIAFFGTTLQGAPSFTFYRDADGDGFGDADVFTQSCWNTSPAGYVENPDDCNDDNPGINLASTEIPCNGLDENCNGFLDDLFLPPPGLSDTTICDGTTLVLSATTNYNGDVVWYDANGNFIHFGNPIVLNDLEANGTSAREYTFYAEEVAGFCYSPTQAEVKVTVLPLPDLFTDERPVTCQYLPFDLTSLSIIDLNQSNGQISFHTGIPADGNNEITSQSLVPDQDITIFIKSTAAGGCFDTTKVDFEVLESPVVEITGVGDTLSLCKGTSEFISAFVSGGLPGYDAYWQNFDRNPSIRVDATNQTNEIYPVIYTAIDQNNCPGTDTLFVKTIAGVETVDMVINDVTICNGRDGSISLQPLTGNPPFRYIWSGPLSGSQNNQQGAYTISGLEQGSYDITIFDGAENCEFTLTNVVVNGPSAKVELNSVTRIDCHGGNNGAIDLTVTGNNPSILWSNNATTEDLSGLFAGTYSVTVTDGPCTTSLEDILVEEPEVLNGFPFERNVTCNGFDDGTIDIMVVGGNGGYQISWNDNGIGFNRSGLMPGTYAFTIVDNNNCSFVSNPVVIEEPDPLDLSTSFTNATCTDVANGAIFTTVTGGSGSYTYNWSNQSTRPNQRSLLPGSYDLTVTDSKGCFILGEDLVISSPPALGLDLDSLRHTTCVGVEDGGIYVKPSGGVSPYDFFWSNGATSEDLDNLPGGKYQLTLVDNNNCELVTDSFLVIEPSLLNVQFNLRPPLCVGKDDGRITTNIQSGGTGPFSFEWNRGDTSQNLLNVEVGNYAVTITDANGCVDFYDDIEVISTQLLNDNNLIANNPVCHNQSNGIIFSNILGGIQPYFYQWSNNSQTKDIQNLAPGNYQLTVSDSRGCRLVTDTIVIENPDPLSVEVLSMEPVRCAGENSGSISVAASGGEAPYLYSWNNNSYQGAAIANLGGGNYILSVRDDLGCVFENDPIALPEPQPLQLDVTVVSSNSCQLTSSEDSILVEVSGGVGPYHYLWSTNDTSDFLSNIPAGEYDVTVTDENGCEAIVSGIKMPESTSSFVIDQFLKSDISCFGANDGLINISFSGGTPPFQYLWSDGGGNNGGTTTNEFIEANDLQPGRYELTVVDATGCVLYSGNIRINEPDNFAISLVNQQDVTCNGGSDGKMNIRVTGGNFPYSFQWFNANGDPVSNQQNPTSFPVGSYELVVTDYRSCKDTISNLQIEEPDSFFIRTSFVNDVLCKGDSSGSITVNAIGGTPNYVYTWSNQVNGKNNSGLFPGNYMVTVEDANRCVIIEEYTIAEPNDTLRLQIGALSDPLCFNQPNGEVTLSASGGTAPYVYVINNFPRDSNYITGLSAGDYQALVLDSNSCITTLDFSLENPEPIDITFTVRNATQGIWNDGSATANVNGGTPPYYYLWETMDTTATINGLTPGWYILTVIDSLGCVKEGAVQVSSMTSLHETPEWAGQLSIQPIPARDEVFISGWKTMGEAYKVELYSPLGELLATKPEVMPIPGENIPLEISRYPSGFYWVVIKKGATLQSFKISKN
jgi:hypothetical protein